MSLLLALRHHGEGCEKKTVEPVLKEVYQLPWWETDNGATKKDMLILMEKAI